jgi:hypothetical protein
LSDVLRFIVPDFIQSGQFQNLQQNRKLIEYPTGEVVYLSNVFGALTVDVHSPERLPAPARVQEIRRLEGDELRPWEPWAGATSNLCIDHTWRVGLFATDGLRHDYAYCDGSLPLAPPVYDYPPTTGACAPVTVTGFYWLDLSGGTLKSSMYKTTAGIYDVLGSKVCAVYQSSYTEWRAALDTVGPTRHEGKRSLRFDIATEFEGFQEDEAYPNFSFIAVELTDVNANFVRLYFKADPLYLTDIGQSSFLIGDGVVDIAFSDWGLDSDLKIMLITNFNTMLWEPGNFDRLSKYEINYIDFF